MAEILVTEAPGGMGECFQCPYCSHMYLASVVDESGVLTGSPADPPRECRRCGSPMDIGKAQKYQDERALEAAAPAARVAQRTRIV